MPSLLTDPGLTDNWRQSVDPGLCQCGCGVATKIITKANVKRGDIKGKPRSKHLGIVMKGLTQRVYHKTNISRSYLYTHARSLWISSRVHSQWHKIWNDMLRLC